MKNNYTTLLRLTAICMAFVASLTLEAQTIQLSFENAQNTNDGVDDFYEVDVMIQTFDGMADFKMGAAQFYINYNTDAFGVNIYDGNDQENDGVEITFPNDGDGPLEDYIVGQGIDALAAFKVYGTLQLNNNTDFRLSYSNQQSYSSGAFAENNITASPKRLVHIKMKYLDVTEDPMIVFEDDEGAVNDGRDQFFTACGPTDDPFALANCAANPGSQIVDAVFVSDGATLSLSNVDVSNSISIYPNPTSKFLNISSNLNIQTIEMYDVLGKMVLKLGKTEQIKIDQFEFGIYLLKIYSEKGEMTKKVVIK